jgi:hypothetical protein
MAKNANATNFNCNLPNHQNGCVCPASLVKASTQGVSASAPTPGGIYGGCVWNEPEFDMYRETVEERRQLVSVIAECLDCGPEFADGATGEVKILANGDTEFTRIEMVDVGEDSYEPNYEIRKRTFRISGEDSQPDSELSRLVSEKAEQDEIEQTSLKPSTRQADARYRELSSHRNAKKDKDRDLARADSALAEQQRHLTACLVKHGTEGEPTKAALRGVRRLQSGLAEVEMRLTHVWTAENETEFKAAERAQQDRTTAESEARRRLREITEEIRERVQEVS